ncbi:MAG: RecQ family ATP-dependent DNA helicase [Gemmatimonadales bacterium]
MSAEPVVEDRKLADAAMDRARAVLARHYGYPDFRAPQARVVRSILAGRDTLGVLPTGAGKSICFQVPALLGEGLTLVISPLVALMQDQVDAARARGIPARCLNSLQTRAARDEVRAELARGAVKLLYVAPERARTLERELAEAGVRVTLLAVDEAHCVAEWGADFRPAYLGLGRLRRALGAPPTAALTGSATPAVRTTIAEVVGLGRPGGYDLHLGSFDRRNLWFGVERVRSERERLARLLELLRFDDRMALVYAPTRNLTEALARVLREHGILTAAYHAGLDRERRARVLGDFLDDRVEVITATCAFGMGIDKPNVRLVVHWTMPPTPESYYQEAGRAGRDGAPARCILLYRPGDASGPEQQLRVTFPERRLVERARRDPAAFGRMPKNLRLSVERLLGELSRGGRWDRIERRRRAALERLAAVRRYAEGAECRRRALVGYFGERLVRCSGCDRCTQPPSLPATSSARHRTRRLLAVSRAADAPWPSGLLDAGTVARLAADPPDSIEGLAAFPGVGPAVAARFGPVLLAALSDGEERPIPTSPVIGSPDGATASLLEALVAWRDARARELVVAPVEVASLAVLRSIAEARPADRRALGRLPGVGPRFLIADADPVLEIVRRHPVAPPIVAASEPAGA